MKMAGQMIILMSIIIMVTLPNRSNAVDYVVGDEFGWQIPPNQTFYSEWASTKNFRIGDGATFADVTGGSRGNNSFAEVLTLADFENCTDPGIHFWPNLTAILISNGSRFFVSTVEDRCERGMRVIITVGSPTNVSSLVPSSSSPSLPSLSFGALVATTLSAVLVSFFN